MCINRNVRKFRGSLRKTHDYFINHHLLKSVKSQDKLKVIIPEIFSRISPLSLSLICSSTYATYTHTGCSSRHKILSSPTYLYLSCLTRHTTKTCDMDLCIVIRFNQVFIFCSLQVTDGGKFSQFYYKPTSPHQKLQKIKHYVIHAHYTVK